MKKWKTEIKDEFWQPKIEKMCKEIIPYQYEVLNDRVAGIPASHAMENFRLAAGESEDEYSGMLFQDSDVAKWLEAASYSLRIIQNKDVEKCIDETVDLIEKAQREDGYLNTYYICAKPKERLANISHGHEMYCAGHLLEAAVAYAEASGKEKLLYVMQRYLAYLMRQIGRDEGKKRIYPGHPELELALYRCYQYTGNRDYLDFMEYLIDERGKQPSFLEKDFGFGEQYKDKWFSLSYHQAHMPVRMQKDAVGHAVRAVYLYTAAAELAYEKKDKKLEECLNSLWKSVTERKMYLTGSLGSEEHGESFSEDYDLPNDRAYAETCASIGLIFWARQMMRLERSSKYADIIELALYNGAISGISEDGRHYFYVNPLMMLPKRAESRYDLRHVKAERVTWFGCACCPPNLARLMTSLPDYIGENGTEENSFYLNLYAAGTIILDEERRNLEVTGEYLTDGCMKFTFHDKKSGEGTIYTFNFRIPGWCGTWTAKINNEIAEQRLKKGYWEAKRLWKDGDCVELSFEILPRFIYANAKVEADAGRTALMRGPVVYCIEEADNGKCLDALTIEQKNVEIEKDIFLSDSKDRIEFMAYREIQKEEEKLYSYYAPKKEKVKIKAIPYHLWGNRGLGEMLVWMRR